MANNYFRFKKFIIHQERAAMKVTTDSCFFGAWAAEEIKNEKLKIENCLDIGTGTGLLSLMIAQKSNVEIDAVEIDKDAAEQARDNVQSSPWKNSIHVFNEDILSFQTDKQYDCIVSNPPFYENELASVKQNRNVAHHSEELTISQVIQLIQIHLKEDRNFFLLYPFKRKEEIEKLLRQNNLCLSKGIILHQSVNHSPFRIIIKGTKRPVGSGSLIPKSIWDEHQQYTTEFIELLKDYYLYL